MPEDFKLFNSVRKIFVYPWREESLGAREISKGLDARRIRLRDSTFKAADDYVVINWGASRIENEEVRKCRIVNTPTAVDRAADKLAFFKHVSKPGGPRTPPFTEDVEVAAGWVREGSVVVARTKLRARSGADIVFFEDGSEWVKAPLYTLYIPKKEEYRVHVAFGEVIHVQRKVLSSDQDPKKTDFRVRNLANGFIFQINNISPPSDVIDQAVKAAKASNLHFAAIDVIWNEKQQRAYVLEANTAPGIQETTVDKYVEAFRKAIRK